jgi:hypothetical protein
MMRVTCFCHAHLLVKANVTNLVMADAFADWTDSPEQDAISEYRIDRADEQVYDRAS